MNWETGPEDSWGIGFIVFLGTVSAFGIISIGFIGSIGIVAAFDTSRIGVIGCRTNSIRICYYNTGAVFIKQGIHNTDKGKLL